MEWMGLNEIRESFLEFFESKGHTRLPSFSLVPKGDNSLLLINSGMAPLKAYFTGEQKMPGDRATTCQKCIRTPDIERVGKTARHGTFFEMLGNFSFGDYFKSEAAAWAWEFVTKVMKIPADRLWVSIYQDDDEAFDVWTKEVGVDPGRIVRLGKADNFWEHGAGPCGPCSEIYFDRGEKYGCGSPDCAVGCDCDRYVEFWNLVFTQFSSDGQGNYTPLKQKNIDTGMGLERLACIMQGVGNLFEVDTIKNVMVRLSGMCGHTYGAEARTDVSFRVVTDHIRGSTFMVSDGIVPSNEGRGYVLRKLLRRAARHGKMLGIGGLFLSELCDTVIELSGGAYPELAEKRDFIRTVIRMEEERFHQTLGQGESLLGECVAGLKERGGDTLSGEDAFRLYDTFGFPLDLTMEILEEQGYSVDTEGFHTLMKEQREKARAARSAMGDVTWSSGEQLKLSVVPRFVGYETLCAEAKVVAVIRNQELTDAAGEGDEVMVALDVTPFYGESGGQVGDTGTLTGRNGALRVLDTKKTPDGVILLHGRVEAGSLLAGDAVTAQVDETRREAIMRNHSSAHLLQAALRKVLGPHVEQAGSLVDADRMRFDFTHFAALTPEELSRVESEVNAMLLSASQVTTTVTSPEKAREMGAIALFNEKYGDSVRVVRMGEHSIELCGGTHVRDTAQIGLFKILSESSVAAGVRRIEAATGLNVLRLVYEKSDTIEQIAASLRTAAAEAPRRAEQLMAETRALHGRIEQLTVKLASQRVEALLEGAPEVSGVKVLTAELSDMDADGLRLVGDMVKDKYPAVAAVFACVSGEKVTFLAVCGREAVAKGCKAGNIVREVAKLAGGSGGGRPDSAMAGGRDKTMVKEALDAVLGIVSAAR